MKPYGVPKEVVKGYDKDSEISLGKDVGNTTTRARNERRRIWKKKARAEAKASLRKEVSDG